MGMIYSNHLWWFGYGLSKFFWVYHITKYINILVRRSLRSSKPHACARLPPRFKLQELKIQLSCKTSSRKGQMSFKIHGSCKAENSSRTRFFPKTQKTLNVAMTEWFVRFNAKNHKVLRQPRKNGPKDSSYSKCRAHSDPSHRVLFLKVTQSGIHVYTCQDYVCVKTTPHLPRFLKCALSRALVTQNKGSDPSKDGTFVARSRKTHGPQPSSPVEKNTCSKNFLVWTC